MNPVSSYDILSAYRFLLGREPESDLNLEDASRGFTDWRHLREYLLGSPEANVTLLSALKSLPGYWTKVQTRFGRQIYLCLSDIGVAREILLNGDHEPDVGRSIIAHLPPDGVFLDIGANIGWFTLLAADQLARANQGGRVIAVEANPSVVPYLSASVVESGLSDFVSVKPYAVSREIGLGAFDSCTRGNLGGQRVQHVQAVAPERRHVVPVIRLDDLLCDLDRLDVIKIDIEGYEPLALQGGQALIERFRPMIIAEINAAALSSVSGLDPKSFVKMMQEFGYQPFDLNAVNGVAMDADQVHAAVERRGYCDFLFKPVASVKNIELDIPRCLVCDSSSARYKRIDGYDYWKCNSCGHIFIDRKRSKEFDIQFYNSSGYKAIEALWPQSERLKLFKLIISEIETALGRTPQSVLDFGAGSEDVTKKREIAKFVTFYDPHYSLDKIDNATRFDAVIATEVLEHLFDPVSILRQLRGYSDMIFATTLLSDINFTPSYLLPSGGHVSIFSLNSIANAAHEAGFTHKVVYWPGQSQHYYHSFIAK